MKIKSSFVNDIVFSEYDVLVYFVPDTTNNLLETNTYFIFDDIYDFEGGKYFWVKSVVDENLGILVYKLSDLNNEKKILQEFSKIVDLLIERKKSKVIFNLNVFKNDITNQLLENIVMSISLTNYSFETYLTKKKNLLEIFDFYSSYLNYITEDNIRDLNKVINESLTVSEYTIYARNLANERADVASPEYFENLVKQLDLDISVEILSGQELQKEGLSLFYAVGQGARYEPKLICLKYVGDYDNKNKKIAFVGKGITYDTGGLNLKPTNSIENMHLDKSGACAVLATILAVEKMKLPVNLIGILGLAENAIGSKAYKPYSIIKSLNGKTVKVANTDAEGRLVLADCLTWVQRKYNPDIIIDIATLTGACMSALGENFGGIFGNNDSLISAIQEIGKIKYENVFNLPLIEEHRQELKCGDADLNSMGSKYAGASTAAAFLSEFIENENTKWIHLDIAGPAMRSKKNYWFNENGTGFGVRLIYYYLKSLVS